MANESPDPRTRDDLPSGLTPVCVVAYLVGYWLWVYLRPGPQLSVVVYQVLFLLGIAIVLWRAGRAGEIRGYLIGRWWPPRGERRWVWWFLGANAGLYCAGNVFRRLVPGAPEIGRVEALFAAPVVEEFIHRGFILTILLRHMSGRGSQFRAVLLTALLFAAGHGPNTTRLLVIYTAMGLVWGYAVAVTRCVPLGIACHLLWNATVRCPYLNELWRP